MGKHPSIAPANTTPSALDHARSIPQVAKRRKVERACVKCRTLRRKCSGEIRCQSCRNNNWECKYGGESSSSLKLTLGSAMMRIAKLEERLEVYEGLRGMPHSASSPIHDHEAVRNVDNHGDEDEVHDMKPVLRGCSQINKITQNHEFYGGSSTDAVVDAIDFSMARRDNSQADLPRKPSCTSFGAPNSSEEATELSVVESVDLSMAATRNYVQRFFATTHKLYPVLDELAFWDSCVGLWTGHRNSDNLDQNWIFVLYMVVALGMQSSTPITQQESALIASEYFLAARSGLALVPFTGGNINAVHALFLGFVWLYNEENFHEAYLMLGNATRSGYAIGLHRNATSQGLTPDQAQSRVATWWCIFVHETQLAALLGRPCAIQPTEVDVLHFSDDVQVEYQYVERMRQFSHLTWDSYWQVYSLAIRNKNARDREQTLSKCDTALSTWYEARIPSWHENGHGKVLLIHYFNVRVLLYRPFIILTIRKARKQQPIDEELQVSAVKCVETAINLIEQIRLLENSPEGVLQAAVSQIVPFVWNATLSMLLYALDDSLMTVKRPDRADVLIHIDMAIAFFQRHESWSSISRLAIRYAKRILGHDVPEHPSDDRGADFFTAVESSEDTGMLFDFYSFFDMSAFEFGDYSNLAEETGAFY